MESLTFKEILDTIPADNFRLNLEIVGLIQTRVRNSMSEFGSTDGEVILDAIRAALDYFWATRAISHYEFSCDQQVHGIKVYAAYQLSDRAKKTNLDFTVPIP